MSTQELITAGLLPPGPAGEEVHPSRRGARRARAMARAAELKRVLPPIYSLHPKLIWARLKAEPKSFWFLNLYLFFEYVRPQGIYPVLGLLPWAQSFVWLSLAAYLLEGKSFGKLYASDYLFGLFTLVVLASGVTAYSPAETYGHLMSYLPWVLIYLIISRIAVTEQRLLIFMVLYFVYNFKMSQHGTRSWAMDGFAFRTWGIIGAQGWFQNSGELGAEMVVFAVLVASFTFALRRAWGKWTRWLFYAMVVTAIITTVGTSSRGALIGLAAAILVLVLESRYKVRGILLAALGVLLVWLVLPPEQITRFTEAGTDKTSLARKEYWTFGLQVIREHPVLGIGFKNWIPYFQHSHGFPALPHNIFIECAAELGYVGLFAFLLLIGCTLVMNWRTRRMVRPLGDRAAFILAMATGLNAAMFGFLGAGFFVTILYYPFFWINLAMTAALRATAEDMLRRARTAPRRVVTGAPAAAPAPVRPMPSVLLFPTPQPPAGR